MNALNLVSLLLESPGRTLTEDDLSELPDKTGDQLLQLGILRAAPPARSATCDACETGHIEEITRTYQRNGNVVYRIYCPDTGWVEISKTLLQQWSLDVTRLANLLADAVQQGSKATVLEEAKSWRLGDREIAGARFNIALACSSSVSTKTARLPPGRTILICPERGNNGSVEYAAVLSLSDAYILQANRLELRIDQIRARLGVELPDCNVFMKKGEIWVLTYSNKTLYLKDSVGLNYLRQLLATPDVSIPAVTLLIGRASVDPAVCQGSSGQILDNEALRNYRVRVNELTEELSIAEVNNDSAHADELRGELELLTTEVASATGLGGRRRESTDGEKIRKSVSNAVSRAIDKIQTEHKLLGDHLRASVDSGSLFHYSPPSPTDWLT